MSAGPTVVVAVPGLSGGVDEASRHLFGSPEMDEHWRIRVLTTKGQRGALAPLVFASAVVRLVVLRLTGRVDLVHLNLSSRGSAVRKVLLGSVARLLGLPYVIQLHGGGFDTFFHGLPGPVAAVIRWFFGGAERVFVLGEPFGRLVIDEIGVAPERVATLRNAVRMPSGRPRPAPVDDPPLILFTGRLGPGKGIPELLESLAAAAEHPWRAVLAGDGDLDGTRRRAAELGLGDRVEVRGWQSRDQIADLLDRASLFVLPSHLEALSVALLEAMAVGACCITTPVGAHGEIVEHEVNGLLVDPGDVSALTDALARALTDDVLRHRLGDAGRATVRATCSTAVVADQLSTSYGSVLSSS